MPSRWVHEHRFPDREALAAALAGEIKVDLEEAIAARGAASLVVSGGRTPLRLFAQLRSEKLDWTTDVGDAGGRALGRDDFRRQ